MGKVLLTGAAGFIGSATARQLRDIGHEVVGVDSLNDAYDPKIKTHRLESLRTIPGFEFLEGDIEDRRFLSSVFSDHDFDIVVNLAARAGVRYSMENPSVYLQTNAQGTLNILENMVEKGIKKIVLASTSSLYAGHEIPFNEEMAVNRPLSSYAASKKAAEMLCHSFHHLNGIDTTILRYFTVYGPAGRPDMCIFRFIRWIDEGTPITLYGDGEQTRDFTYVEDIARGTCDAMKDLGYEIINLGGGMKPVSLLEVIKKIEELFGKEAKLDIQESHPADISETRADVRKAKEVLGWEPKVSLEEGLERCVDWYNENKDWVGSVALD